MSVWHTPQATSLTSTSPGARLGQVELLHDERTGRTPRARAARTFMSSLLVPSRRSYLFWRGRSTRRARRRAVARCSDGGSASSANSGQRPGTPFSSWKPRSANSNGPPTTVPNTVPETSTSPGAGERADARGDVHRHAADVIADQLALAGVDADADLDAELAGGGGDRQRAAQRARGRPVEGREEAVADRLDLAAAEARAAPCARARRGGRAGRASGRRRARRRARSRRRCR